ncbi:MAG: PfkB family carbohydrate kinase [Chloroflexi bacterium]|nr:PfkB family carbohydrate kinase [Chloroflexota bacterium]
MIKPNETEVSILAEREPTTLAEFAEAAVAIAARYETIVVLSLGKKGALAVKGETAVYVQPPSVQAKSAVGSGDCMVAGLVYGFMQGLGWVESVKYGVAAGTANTLTLGAGRFSRHDFDNVLSRVIVSKARV